LLQDIFEQADEDDSLPSHIDPPSLRQKKLKGFLGKTKTKVLRSTKRDQPLVIIIEDDEDKVEVESTVGGPQLLEGKIGMSVTFEFGKRDTHARMGSS